MGTPRQIQLANEPSRTGHQQKRETLNGVSLFLLLARGINQIHKPKGEFSLPSLFLSIAAASDNKKRNKKKPDIVVVKNVAKAVVHK